MQPKINYKIKPGKYSSIRKLNNAILCNSWAKNVDATEFRNVSKLNKI
jgi:hypothetical protein